MTPFAQGLAEQIAENGPMLLSQWMDRCNTHYYGTRDPLGRDFTTAPEISQMFGELIGLWLADLWQRAGSPSRVILAELGPGRGTLMADAMRATRNIPGFRAALMLHSVEASPVLRDKQAITLDVIWHETIHTLPDGVPVLLIANEFLDALPVRHKVRAADGWYERAVACADGRFRFVHGRAVVGPPQFPEAPPGSVHEHSIAASTCVLMIAKRIAAQGGAALLVDYGHTSPALGETLQAVRDGQAVEPLVEPGEADLTAHVDFAEMAETAALEARVHGPIPQGLFLPRLGLMERTHALARANPAQAAALHAAAARLTAPSQMGALFHVLALTAPDWPTPAGFAP